MNFKYRSSRMLLTIWTELRSVVYILVDLSQMKPIDLLNLVRTMVMDFVIATDCVSVFKLISRQFAILLKYSFFIAF